MRPNLNVELYKVSLLAPLAPIIMHAAQSWLYMARFKGKKSLEKSNRNKANRFKKSMEFLIDQIF